MTMTGLPARIESAFGSEPFPSEEEFVRHDGFDELGKGFLLENLYGMTQNQVLQLLRDGALGSASAYTEELEVAETAGIRYYLAPFLVHLAERIGSGPCAMDDEAPFFLFAHIRNILERRGKETFTASQLQAISALVGESRKALASLQQGIWVKDVATELACLDEVLART